MSPGYSKTSDFNSVIFFNMIDVMILLVRDPNFLVGGDRDQDTELTAYVREHFKVKIAALLS